MAANGGTAVGGKGLQHLTEAQMLEGTRYCQWWDSTQGYRSLYKEKPVSSLSLPRL